VTAAIILACAIFGIAMLYSSVGHAGASGYLAAMAIAKAPTLPFELPLYILAAVVGGGIGSGLGARRISGEFIRVLLAVVLLIAAGKMLLTAFS